MAIGGEPWYTASNPYSPTWQYGMISYANTATTWNTYTVSPVAGSLPAASVVAPAASEPAVDESDPVAWLRRRVAEIVDGALAA